MKRKGVVVLLLALMATMMCRAAAPDFAYPQTVSKQAEAALDKAVKEKNGVAVVRALADLGLAQNAIGREKLAPVVKRIESVKAGERDSVTRALLCMLLADIYSDVYSSNRYVYDKRQQPLLPFPENYEEWSGAQFKRKIGDLCDEAMLASKLMQQKKLSDYSDIISVDAEGLLYYPTLYDFAADFTIKKRKSLSNCYDVLSGLYLSEWRAFVAMPKFVPSSVEVVDILKTYSDWLEFHKNSVRPFINVDIERVKFVYSGLYSSIHDDSRSRVFELFKEMFEKYSALESCCEILLAIENFLPDKLQDNRWYFNALEQAVKKFPSYHRVDCLNSILANLKRQDVTVNVPSLVAPMRELEIRATSKNMAEATIDFYRVQLKSRIADYYENGSGEEKLVKSVTFKFGDEIPFSATQKINVELAEPGWYVARVRGNESQQGTSQVIHCTLLSIGSQGVENSTLMVLNPLSGEPVGGALVERIESKGKSGDKITSVGKTDKNGFLKRENYDNSYCYYAASKDGDIYGVAYGNYFGASGNNRQTVVVQGFTDLTIYHPGDTVKFVGVAYRNNGKELEVLSGKEMTCVALMPNGQRLDTIKGVTDDFGRVSGAFLLPKDGLTGQARITFATIGYRGVVGFTVSDYKLPTFMTKVTALMLDEPGKGDVTLKGVAESYSGVAIADSRVKMELGSSNRWGWGGNINNFYSAECLTDKSGNFKIEIPANVFEYAPNPSGVFTARFTVTSGSGESRQCVRVFSLGKKLNLSVSAPGSFNVTKPLVLSVKIEDGEQRCVVQPVQYTILGANDSVVARGTFMSDNAQLDLNGVPSGRYSISFETENAEPYKVGSIVLYRMSDKRSPVDEVLWSPNGGNVLSVDNGRKCSIVLAAGATPLYVLYSLQSVDSKELIEQKWIKLTEGINEIEVKLPTQVVEARACFFAVNNFKSSKVNVTLENRALKKQFALLVESERDKMVPNSEETIRLRTMVAGVDSVGKESAVILNMWNAALGGIDGLYLPNLNLKVRSVKAPQFDANVRLGYNFSLNYWIDSKKRYNCISFNEPEWQLYGLSFSQSYSTTNRIMVRGTKAMSAAAGAVMMKEMKAESAVAMDVVEESVASFDAGVMEENTATTTQVADEKVSSRSEEAFSYREVATPSAFFAPMLKTDSNGKLEFSFAVPNANAQWNFQALAYDRQMASARVEKVFMATRPIIVQSNLSRFLRYGDHTTVRATVSNKSERREDVKVVTEFFDVATGVVIERSDTIVVLSPDETANVGIGFVAPADKSVVGYRIKATTERYADGEQHILPLLPFVTPVIETKPFYMSPDSLTMAIKLPEMKDDARVTLQFCENPTWYVVTALPGLQKGSPQTAMQAAHSIFSASVARGLLKKHPAIREALEQWRKQPSDSMLVSMLERNNDLKIMLLESTPWMADAENDTERMQRLALLFNEKEIKSAIESGMNLLKKLHVAGEGWSWHSSWNEPSQWVTMEVLSTFGRLNKLGFLPANKELKDMISSSLGWLEAQNVKVWKKNRNVSFVDYVAMRDLWLEYSQSVSGKQLTASTVQKLVAGWKKQTVAEKAVSALILSAHGYKPVAKQILQSINEYAVVTPESGMHWPSVGDAMSGSVAELKVATNVLEAYCAIASGAKEIDLIRQWLVVQKETRDWGTSSTVSDVIAVFLGCGADWVVPAKGAVLTLNGKQIEASACESRLGNYNVSLTPTEVSGAMLDVEKRSQTPAWGAVYTRFNAIPTEVKAQSCDGLSITKRMFKLVGTEWVETNDYKVGDRVQIQLIVKASRALDYVAITDDRAACFEPVSQLPGWMYSEGIGFYRENRDSATNIFVKRMPKGTYLLSYEMWANSSGQFASGLAQAQSQYAPQITAHSAGSVVAVVP